jgi:uncharacterized damage-inducible protein DinB
MNERARDLSLLLVRELEGIRREIELFSDDASLWRTLPGVTNAAGNLALHVAGNLQHYVGAVLGGTDYVRNRDAEFSRRRGSAAEILAELDAAIKAVRGVLPGLSADRIDAPYPETINSAPIRTGLFLCHLATHAAFHLGQLGYLRRTLTGDTRTSGAVPIRVLTE